MHLDHRGAHFPNFWPVFVASIYNVTILQLARNQEKNEQTEDTFTLHVNTFLLSLFSILC